MKNNELRNKLTQIFEKEKEYTEKFGNDYSEVDFLKDIFRGTM